MFGPISQPNERRCPPNARSQAPNERSSSRMNEAYSAKCSPNERRSIFFSNLSASCRRERTLVHSAPPNERFPEALGGHGRPWPAMGGHGRPRPARAIFPRYLRYFALFRAIPHYSALFFRAIPHYFPHVFRYFALFCTRNAENNSQDFFT